jgi:hypothetical protein
LLGSEQSRWVCTVEAVGDAVAVVAKAADCEATARPPVIRAAADRSAGALRRIEFLLR